MGDPALYRRGGRNRRVREIHLAFNVAHPPHEVPVRGGDGPLPGREYAHVPSEAGPARRGAYDGPGLEEYLEIPPAHGLVVYIRGSRYYYEPHVAGDPFPL